MSLDWIWNELSQMYGTPGACSVTSLFTLAQALLRSAPEVRAASCMALLTFGSLSCVQFTLPAGRIEFPENVGRSIDSGSVKSLNQPTDGQTFGSFFGTPQNFVYIVSRGTLRNVVLKPSFSNSLWA